MNTDEEKALYAGAVNYADAAQLVFAHPSSSGRDGLILPTHTLIGLSIESSASRPSFCTEVVTQKSSRRSTCAIT